MLLTTLDNSSLFLSIVISIANSKGIPMKRKYFKLRDLNQPQINEKYLA